MKTLLTQRLNVRALLTLLLQVSANLVVNGAPYREIQIAVRNDDFAQIQSMIEADGGVKSDTAALCLMVGALWDKQAIMEKLLAAGIPVNASPTYASEAGETPLTYAIFGAHENTVAFLLKRGANPNYRGDCQFRDCAGLMPLDLAVKADLIGIARQLLDVGADPNAGRNSAVETANREGELKMFQLLTAHGGRLRSGESTPVASQQNGNGTADAERFHALGLAELLPASRNASMAPENKTRCRLAVIADDADFAAADVLVARLTACPALELIERQELERIFAEKQLTRDFASREANYNSVAALLQADALLLVRTRDIGGQKVIEARFIRVHPGIVLDTVYHAAPLMDAKAWADEMSGRVVNLTAKAVRGDGVALSVLDVHAALPTAASSGFERTLSVLFRDRLVHDPRFIMLERAEMEKVAFESTGAAPFWAGSYLVDSLVETALNNNDGFTLTVRLQPMGKGSVITATVSGRRAEPARAIDDLIQRIDQEMGGKDTAPPRADALTEAKSHLEEARWALAAKMPARAEAAAEVAWALGLQTLEVAKLRVLGAEEAVRDGTSQRSISGNAPLAEPLDLAIQAVGVWDDMLQGGALRDHPDEIPPWLESISDLTEVVTLAITSVKPAAAQIEQADRLGALRKMYWAALNNAWVRAGTLPSNAALLEKLTATQLATAQLMLPNADELRAALQELLSRHFPSNDLMARAALRLSIRWRVCKVALVTASGSSEINHWLPENDSVRKWLLELLRRSSAPEDHFIASAIDLEGPVILPPDDSATLMENFWDMREVLAHNPELFKPYFGRLLVLIENEPVGDKSYVPRTYHVTLALDGDTEKKPREITQFEFYGQLALYLINHSAAYEPEFANLANRYAYRYSPELNTQLQEACNRYAARTGAAPMALGHAEPRRRESPAPDGLPPLQARKLWHPFDLGRNIAPEFVLHKASMQWRENRLWVLGHAQQYDEPIVHHFLFSIELPSMRTDTIELPVGPPRGTPYKSGTWLPSESAYVLTPDQVLLTVRDDFFAIYDRTRREWELYRELKPSSAPVLNRGAAYFEVEGSSAMVRFDLKSRTTRLLVSTRRKPAESPLDNPDFSLGGIWTNGAGEVVVSARKNIRHLPTDARPSAAVGGQPDSEFLAATWSPERNDWRISQGWIPAPPPDRGLLSDAGSVTRMNLGVGGGAIIGTRSPADGSLTNTWLALRLNDPAARIKSMPLELAIGDYANLPESRYGRQPLNIILNAYCFACPEGYIIPPPFGPGFWFISRQEFDRYVSTASQSKEMVRP